MIKTKKRDLLSLGIFIGLSIIYALLHSWCLAGAIPAAFSDTKSYIDVFRNGLTAHFFGNERPFSYPVLLWLCNHDLKLVITLQSTISTICWLIGAWVLCSFFEFLPARYFVFISLLLISLSLEIIQWDCYVLTESLSISSFVLLVCLFLLGQRKIRYRIVIWGLFLMVAIIFSFLRDVHAFILPFFSLLFLAECLKALAKGNQKSDSSRFIFCLIAATGLLLAFILQNHDILAARRYWYNLDNVYNLRVMVDEKGALNREHYEWLHDRFGLPSEALQRAAKNATSLPPISPVYRQWLEDNGLRSWRSFLMHHPIWVCRVFFEKPCIYGSTGASYFQMYSPNVQSYRWAIPVALYRVIYKCQEPIFSSRFFIAALLLSFFSFSILLIRAMLRKDCCKIAIKWKLLMVLLYSALIMLFLAKFGDAMENWRHALIGLVALYLLICIIFGSLIDEMTQRVKEWRQIPAGVTEKSAPKLKPC